MKITIGHLLVVAGLGAYVVLGPLKQASKTGVEIDRVAEETAPAPAANSLPVVEDRLPQSEPPADSLLQGQSVAEIPAAAPEIPPPPVVAPPEPVVPKVEPKAAASPRIVRRRRTTTKKVAAPPVKDPVANLVGFYVALKLKNGREIKGALVEKTATTYKLELPGMGEMEYAANDVVSVTQVQ